MKNFFLIYLILFAFSSCVSISKDNLLMDELAKQFKSEPQLAVIYIYRNQFLGGANTADVIFNNKVIGQTRYGHFLRITVKPGLHVIASRTSKTEYLELKAESGYVYYIWQNLRFYDDLAYLQLVDESIGKLGVKECQLVQHLQPE